MIVLGLNALVGSNARSLVIVFSFPLELLLDDFFTFYYYSPYREMLWRLGKLSKEANIQLKLTDFHPPA